MAAEIKANYENIPALERLKESLAQPHGASILAMIMLDNKYAGLEMELTFANEILFNIYVRHITTVWQKYDAEPCLIRSHMRNGVWTTEYGAFDNGVQAYQQIASDRTYGNKKNIIEISERLREPNSVVRDNAERLREPNSVVRDNAERLREPNSVVRDNAERLREPNSVVRDNAERLREPNSVVRDNAERLREPNSVVRDNAERLREPNSVVRDNAERLAERGNQVVFTILRWNTPRNKILTLNLMPR